MKFRNEHIDVFNSYSDTTLTEDMTFSEAIENIESANTGYFYVSLLQENVLEAIEDEKEMAEKVITDLVYLEPLGIAIAITG